MAVRAMSVAGGLLALAGSVFGQASLGGGGYSESFDGMGPSGTTRPTGWSHWTILGGNTTFTASSTLASIAGALPTAAAQSGALSVLTQSGTNPGANANAGYNLGLATSPNDRALGVAPTSVGAAIMQLALTNDTGAPLSALSVGYDFRVFSNGTPQGGAAGAFAAGSETELPGFRVFYSLGGDAGPWVNVAGLNLTPPNPVAVGASIASFASFPLASPLAAGGQIRLRWFKDNENAASPDPFYGIDNVRVVPAPGPAAAAVFGLLLASRRRR